MCAQNRPSCQGLTAFILSARVWLDRLAEMQMIISCTFFFFFFSTLFLHESQRLAGKSCLSIHGCKTRMPGPVFGRVDGLVIDTFLWLNWQRTCKQIDEVKVNTSEIWGSLTKTGIPLLDAITSTVEWQLLNVLKPAEFTPDLLIIDEFNKCANRLILRFVDLFFLLGWFCSRGCRRIGTETARWWAGE